MIDFIKSQIKDGKSVPFRYREYGGRAVEELFYERVRVQYIHKYKGELLKRQTEEDMKEYAFLEKKMFYKDYSRDLFFAGFEHSDT